VKNPIQPLAKDHLGTLRFKSNKIVEHLLEIGSDHGHDLNKIACMNFSKDDRQQFAQLIGYSLGGYGELSYVDNDAYNAAEEMANGAESEDKARIKCLEAELEAVRNGLREPIARLYGVHPDDLGHEG
jgi:hypothetical protein